MMSKFIESILFYFVGTMLVNAQPSTPLPSGYTWSFVSSNIYNDGPYYTGNASGNLSSSSCCSGGGTTCGTGDTSFGGGTQCSSVPWSIVGTPGANFIQAQKYGNIGSCDNSLVGLAVPCNSGVGGTGSGTNWPASTSETRRLDFTNWSNSNPESTIASLPLASRTSGTVWLPTSAELRFLDDGIGDGTGAGADEFRLTMIGGDNGSCASWSISANYNLSIAVSGPYGTSINGVKINNPILQTLTNIPNAGNDGAGHDYMYHATDNNPHNAGCGGFQSSVNSWFFPGGANTASVGAGFTQTYNIFPTLVSDGSTFTVDFTSAQVISIDRVGGTSGDARATMGPGMGGKAQLYVTYQIYTIQAPAPVELASFDVIKNGKQALLTWQTWSELNNRGFMIERNDGINENWEEIGFVEGKNSTSEHTYYQFTDVSPFSHVNYYRLKQMDFDGQTSFSNIKSLTFDRGQNIEINPNPASGLLIINAESEIEMNVYNADGKWMKSMEISLGNQTLDIHDLPSGMYILKWIQSNETFVRRICKN